VARRGFERVFPIRAGYEITERTIDKEVSSSFLQI